MRSLAVIVLMLSGCGKPESKCGPSTAEVDYVVDGDTSALGGGTKIRLLLVDTPETTKGKNDCYGKEATDFTVSRVAGRKIDLSYDEGACTDRYGRTLAYVKTDGVELNTELAKQGFACFLYVKPGGEARQEEFATYESEAKTNRTGMWGSCTLIPCSM